VLSERRHRARVRRLARHHLVRVRVRVRARARVRVRVRARVRVRVRVRVRWLRVRVRWVRVRVRWLRGRWRRPTLLTSSSSTEAAALSPSRPRAG